MNWLDLPAIKTAQGIIRLPGSKSISNRLLLLAALAQGVTHVRDLLASDDTDYMLKALTELGVDITQTGDDSYRIVGTGGQFKVRKADLFLGNAGTAFRPLTAVLALMEGRYRLSGVARMCERPIGDLVDALRSIGADITYLDNQGYPPLQINPAALDRGDIHLSVKGDVSSQFLTGLLMALPVTGKKAVIEVSGILISQPYVALTLAQMRKFGVVVEHISWQRFILPAHQYYCSPGDVMVEGDASSASYFLAAGAIGSGPVRVHGVGYESVQGDVRFAEALEEMGACVRMDAHWIESSCPHARTAHPPLRAIDLDCNHMPDAAMTLAVTALFANGVTTLKNIASWRLKETDRLSAMAKELKKLGADIEEGADYIGISPPKNGLTPGTTIDTYDDHRLAMCFSLAAFGVPIRINDPGCVSKTFPDYFDQFKQIARFEE
ncbi:3-phosphoshikimate 1-carboxyvinyltransferase [Nitrosomonas sp. Nm51]|uniref:3-phosphoshikimate 1-carboxyvinyltransferase n=1 Tax=Nitrosomonas sp. Nm51 TaxID=133720 RepID=UPI0008C08E28|nr:3-phosphoshikimate 1-carboxyvinyltransferase [Nitrosomonas sp. Nm51]SER39043.1 3-phosphoshikimate 1-carboxyvinyltransferase [Nitrosomonas sp. Nm51]